MFQNKLKISQKVEEMIKIYNTEESNQESLFSVYELQAFSSYTWDKLSIPVRIKKKKELSRYFDFAHDLRFEQNIDIGLRGGFSDDEWELFKRATKLIYDCTKELDFDNPQTGYNSLSRAFCSYRFIKQNYKKDTKILEIGPGSGYLGLLLILDGYDYAAVENSQALYLYQTIIFNKTKKPFKLYTWWEFLNLSELNDINLICACHVLSEMHPKALKFLIQLFTNNKKIEIFFENLGYYIQNNSLNLFSQKNYYLNFYKEISNTDISFGVMSKNLTGLVPISTSIKALFLQKNIKEFYYLFKHVLSKRSKINILPYFKPNHSLKVNNPLIDFKIENINFFKKDVVSFYKQFSNNITIPKSELFSKKIS